MTEHPSSTEATSIEDFFGPPVSRYTRADAFADGTLVDVSETAFEAGFQWPVALTRAAWEDCVAWSEADTARQTYQDVAGRLWDVLWMAWVKVRVSLDAKVGTDLLFGLRRVPRKGRCRQARRTTLKLVSGPGDDGEPVLTIMLPNEV